MEGLIDTVLVALLIATAVAILRLRNLFAAVMLSGFYSLLMAGVFVILDAVDVAFTEAAVGAGITTVLMLGTLALTTSREKIPVRLTWPPALLVGVVGLALLYSTLDLPEFGKADNPVNGHVVPRYIADSERETGVPNIVTAVLASYRGYDTLGETTVIFTAGVGVMLLLGVGRRRKEDDE